MSNEIWKVIPEFPNYSVSMEGHIRNNRSDRFILTGANNFGHVKVNLFNGQHYRCMSVALLVAEAFVQPPDPLSDCVIILDGNLQNVYASNLALRPRWFAWKYARQLRTPPRRHYLVPVFNFTIGRRYPTIVVCGMTEGLLFSDIWHSANRGGHWIYPHNWQFEFE